MGVLEVGVEVLDLGALEVGALDLGALVVVGLDLGGQEDLGARALGLGVLVGVLDLGVLVGDPEARVSFRDGEVGSDPVALLMAYAT